MKYSEFLESVPPGQAKEIDDAVAVPSGNDLRWLNSPLISLFCENCNGDLRCDLSNSGDTFHRRDASALKFVSAKCRNCQAVIKHFAVMLMREKDTPACVMVKFGEIPQFGKPFSNKLLKLVGADQELLKRGRRCENQGLGIGAAAYYRRVVENQRTRLLEEIIKAAVRHKAPAEQVQGLRNAITEPQFKRSLEMARDALPKSLYVLDHNPLTLLHSALSKNIHDLSEEDCLDISFEIREMLTLISESIVRAIEDEDKLKQVVGRLLKHGSDPPAIDAPE